MRKSSRGSSVPCKKDRIVGQIAIEYLVLLGLLVIIAITAMHVLLPQAYVQTRAKFTDASLNIVGNQPDADVAGFFP